MAAAVARFFPQPFVALLMSIYASVGLAAAWVAVGWGSGATRVGAADLLVAAVLVCWVAASYQFPIHLRRSLKVEMTTVALYLIAVLLPSPALAATCAALGVLAGEILVRNRRGNYFSDVATAASRWTIVVLVASVVGYVIGSGDTLYLVAVAAIMWVG